MDTNRLYQLMADYLEERITAPGKEELRLLLAHPAMREAASSMIGEQLETGAFTDEADLGALEARIAQLVAARQRRTVKMVPLRRWMAAAAVLAVVVTTTFLLLNKQPQLETIAVRVNVPAPATNRATIQLADGRTVYLDSAANGQLASLGQVRLVKLADGKIAYTGSTAAMQYNTLTNPRGSRPIDMVLTDGSHVWLNAGSSITYPVVFAGDKRVVSMRGEAYFEVAHDSRRPFTVTKGETSVQVLGTHFNVKAYDEEPALAVTLLEGSVNVRKGALQQLLRPGQQAVVANNIELIQNADTEEAMAWKNGRTLMNDGDVESVLREIERWYGIETEIQGTVPKRSFYLDVNRDGPLSEMLHVLELNHVRFAYDAEKKKLTVRQ